jgi:hypothetical protein
MMLQSRARSRNITILFDYAGSRLDEGGGENPIKENPARGGAL